MFLFTFIYILKLDFQPIRYGQQLLKILPTEFFIHIFQFWKKKRLDTTATKIVFVKSKKIKNLESVDFFVRSQGFDSQMLKKIWISKSKFWFRIFRKKFVNSKQLNVSTVVFDASGSIFFSLPDHLTSKSSDPAVPALLRSALLKLQRMQRSLWHLITSKWSWKQYITHYTRQKQFNNEETIANGHES